MYSRIPSRLTLRLYLRFSIDPTHLQMYVHNCSDGDWCITAEVGDAYRRLVQHAVPRHLEAGMSDVHLETESAGKVAPWFDRMPY